MHSQLFTPSLLLPHGQSLFLDYEQEALFLLTHDMQVQQRLPLTSVQLRFVAELLTAYPGVCSSAQLLAVLVEQPLEECQEQRDSARQGERTSDLLCETREALDCCNRQLEVLGLQVAAVLDTSYVLIPRSHRYDEHVPQRDLHPFIHVRFNWRTGAMLMIPPFLL